MCLSTVRPSAWNNSDPTGQFSLNLIKGTLHEDLSTFMTSRWILLRTRNVSDKKIHQNTFYVQLLFPRKWCSVWDNVEIYGRARQATGYNLRVIWLRRCDCMQAKVATLTLIILSSLLETFALLGCYAAKIGSYRRFGTTYRSPWRWDR
jgi:hypothetical protein